LDYDGFFNASVLLDYYAYHVLIVRPFCVLIVLCSASTLYASSDGDCSYILLIIESQRFGHASDKCPHRRSAQNPRLRLHFSVQRVCAALANVRKLNGTNFNEVRTSPALRERPRIDAERPRSDGDATAMRWRCNDGDATAMRRLCNCAATAQNRMCACM
jgi:hypothetical protein